MNECGEDSGQIVFVSDPPNVKFRQLLGEVQVNYVSLPGSPEAKLWAKRQKIVNRFVDQEIGSDDSIS
jgi:hypothetical protein